MRVREPAAAFERLYRSEHRRLLSYLTRRVGPDEAPDLAQEVFARLCGSRAAEGITDQRAYLSRIMRNLLIDRARRTQRNPVVHIPFGEECRLSVGAEQAWRIETIDMLRLYRRTARAMPPKMRRVFVMHRMRHMSYKQIAEQLGIGVRTVEYHMARALTLCRAMIAERW